MFEKLDFSDIYKFCASIGLGFIVAAIMLPLYLSQIDVAKNYQRLGVPDVSYSVIQNVVKQESLVSVLLENWLIPSVGLCLLGFLFFAVGVWQWKKRQDVVDQLQNLELQQKENSIKLASSSEVDDKLNEDVDEIEDDVKNKKETFQVYRKIENAVVDAIKTTNPNVKISQNAKVNNFVYDLIIIRRLGSIARLHKVCEIKYYQKEIFYSYVLHGVSSFLLAVANYQKHIAADEKWIALEHYIIWICTTNTQKERLKGYADKIRAYAASKGVDLQIILKLDSELNTLKKDLGLDE